MVPVPMAASSGGTELYDHEEFYRQSQQQQVMANRASANQSEASDAASARRVDMSNLNNSAQAVMPPPKAQSDLNE